MTTSLSTYKTRSHLTRERETETETDRQTDRDRERERRREREVSGAQFVVSQREGPGWGEDDRSTHRH